MHLYSSKTRSWEVLFDGCSPMPNVRSAYWEGSFVQVTEREYKLYHQHTPQIWRRAQLHAHRATRNLLRSVGQFPSLSLHFQIYGFDRRSGQDLHSSSTDLPFIHDVEACSGICLVLTPFARQLCPYQGSGYRNRYRYRPSVESIGIVNIGHFSAVSVLDSNPNLKTVASFISQESMTIELLSFTDNKEGVAKAASFLCTEYLKGDGFASDKKEPIFTETDMNHALKAIDCGGVGPDLLLVYGPA